MLASPFMDHVRPAEQIPRGFFECATALGSVFPYPCGYRCQSSEEDFEGTGF
jgi:hypothetical protein